MGSTRKLEYDAFSNRARSVRWLNNPYYYEVIFEADAALEAADTLLQQTADIQSIGYEKQYENLYRILDTYGRLVTFMENFRAEVNNTDESFYTEVVNGAAEDLSHVALSDIEIPNTIGLQEYNPDTGMYTPKDNLSIEDFLGNNGSSLEPSVEGFKEIFEQTLDLSGKSYTMAEIIAELEKGTRYSNDIHNPGLEALAFIVDCVSFGIKPLFDCISGYDIITGEELSDSEQGWRGVDAALSLLDIFGITKLASMGLKTIGREVLEEVAEQAGKKVIQETGERIGKEVLEEAGEQIGKEVLEETGEQLGKEVLEESSEQIGKEIAEEASEEIGKEVLEEAGEEIGKEAIEETSEQIGKEIAEETGEEIGKEVGEEAQEEIAKEIVEEGSERKILTVSEAEEYAFNAIKGLDNAEVVVLGKYEKGSVASYDEVAKDMNAQYFNLDNWDELSSQYSKEEIWKINERFLDIQTSSGREIYLSHNPADYIGDGSYYSKEIQYLIDNGYRLIQEGDVWHAIR